MKIFGFPIDSVGRCRHYHGVNDIVSIKFNCCEKYYPCYKCHEENEDHPILAWNKEDFSKKAILCGNCHTEITINDYVEKQKCTHCNSSFNPNCSLYYDIYFNME